MHADEHVCVHTHMQMNMCACIHTHTHKYRHIHTYAHTHAHTLTYTHTTVTFKAEAGSRHGKDNCNSLILAKLPSKNGDGQLKFICVDKKARKINILN